MARHPQSGILQDNWREFFNNVTVMKDKMIGDRPRLKETK